MARRLSAEDAIAFAKSYTQLVEALMREGVEEDMARDEAHVTAMELLHVTDYLNDTGTRCPVCGR